MSGSAHNAKEIRGHKAMKKKKAASRGCVLCFPRALGTSYYLYVGNKRKAMWGARFSLVITIKTYCTVGCHCLPTFKINKEFTTTPCLIIILWFWNINTHNYIMCCIMHYFWRSCIKQLRQTSCFLGPAEKDILVCNEAPNNWPHKMKCMMRNKGHLWIIFSSK